MRGFPSTIRRRGNSAKIGRHKTRAGPDTLDMKRARQIAGPRALGMQGRWAFKLLIAANILLGCAPQSLQKKPESLELSRPPSARDLGASIPKDDPSNKLNRSNFAALNTSAQHSNSIEMLPGLPEPEPPPVLYKSSALPSGFFNPMPGGVFAGYRADTGLDIAGSPRPVYAIAAGTLDYSEPGHTLWTGRGDTANCVRIRLDRPIAWKGRKVTHIYYAHLSELEYLQAEGSPARKAIEAGERLGKSGKARGSPHLHLGFLLDGEVEQYLGTFLLEDEIRELLGGYKNGKSLPK